MSNSPASEVSKQLFSMADAIRALGLCRTTILKHIDAGLLPAHKVGRDWRFTQDDFDTFYGRTAV